MSWRGTISGWLYVGSFYEALETSCTIPFLRKPIRNPSVPSKVGFLLGKFHEVRFSLWID